MNIDIHWLKEQAIELEIQVYRDTESIDFKENPLEWWKIHEKNFPHVSNIARQVLSIPATSAASERVFSTGGRTISKLRASLNSENAGDLIYLKGSWGTIEQIQNNKNH